MPPWAGAPRLPLAKLRRAGVAAAGEGAAAAAASAGAAAASGAVGRGLVARILGWLSPFAVGLGLMTRSRDLNTRRGR
ncbi:hypothetical protein ACTMU2_29325 [Cupriavidus basilensis]